MGGDTECRSLTGVLLFSDNSFSAARCGDASWVPRQLSFRWNSSLRLYWQPWETNDLEKSSTAIQLILDTEQVSAYKAYTPLSENTSTEPCGSLCWQAFWNCMYKHGFGCDKYLGLQGLTQEQLGVRAHPLSNFFYPFIQHSCLLTCQEFLPSCRSLWDTIFHVCQWALH